MPNRSKFLRRALFIAVVNGIWIFVLIGFKGQMRGIAELIPNSVYAVMAAFFAIYIHAALGLVWARMNRSTPQAIVLWVAVFFIANALLISFSIPLVKMHFGEIKRRVALYELKNYFLFLGQDSDLQYRFDTRPSSAPLPLKEGRLLKASYYDEELFSRTIQRVAGVETDRYLSDILAVIDRPEDRAQKRVGNIVKFVQRALLHDAFGQPPLAHPVVVLEYGSAHCTIANQYVLSSLLAKASFTARPIQLIHHSVLEVLIGDNWYIVDADMFDEVILDGEGHMPTLDWLRQSPNYYIVDQYSRTRPFYDYPVNEAGERVSGLVSSGRIEDTGYPSYHYGAPLEFAPSRPRLLRPRIRTNTGKADIRWDRVYDRDGDLQHYWVEVGTNPGSSDVGMYKTRKNRMQISLEDPGLYYYRIRAVDDHMRHNEQTYYLSSEEGVILWDEDGTDAEGHKKARTDLGDYGTAIEDSHSMPTVDLDEFQLVTVDSTYTALFDIPWRGGRGLRMVDLSDPYSPEGLPFPTRSTKIQRYQRPLELPADGHVRILFDVEIKKSGYGGDQPIPIVAVGNWGEEGERWQILLEILPGEHLLVLRSVGEMRSAVDHFAQKEITAEFEVYRIQLQYKNQSLRAIMGEDSAGAVVEIPMPFSDGYIELRSNGSDQVDYVFGNLRVVDG